MKKVFKFVKGKKEERRDGGSISRSQSRDLSSPARTPEDEAFLGLDAEPGYAVDACGRDKSLTKLHKAAWLGQLEKVKSALKKVEVDAVDGCNRTALHLAVARGHPAVVWYLLNNDAKVSVRDGDGCTPLLKAVECGNKECVTLLLDRGADANDSDYRGNTGLHLAARRSTLDISSGLLNRGALVDVANSCGEYPLHVATRAGNKDLAEMMLRAGASANASDRENRTPLMLAAKMGDLLLARLFVDHGANLTTVDSNGWTAEDYALLNGHEAVAEELKNYAETSVGPSRVAEPTAGVDCAGNGSSVDDDDDDEEDSALRDRDDDPSDSPTSEKMPPPCRPPRSWEMIQAGMIDAGHEGGESKRRSITALGTLRTRKESFTDSNGCSSSDAAGCTLSLTRRRTPKRAADSVARNRLSLNEERSVGSLVSDPTDTLWEIDDARIMGEKTENATSFSDWDSDRSSATCRTERNSSRAHDRPSAARKESAMPFDEPNGIDEIWVANPRIDPETAVEMDDRLGKTERPHEGKDEGRPPPNGPREQESSASKRHARHHSVSANKWRNEDAAQSRESADVDRRIDEQLRCYDQALKELAEASCVSKSDDPVDGPRDLVRGGIGSGSREPRTDAEPETAESSHDAATAAASESAAAKSKRQMLLAMREVKYAVHVAHSFYGSVDEPTPSPTARPADGSDSDDRDDGNLFFRSNFTASGRQETVIEKSDFRRKSSSSGTGEETTLRLPDAAAFRSPDGDDRDSAESAGELPRPCPSTTGIAPEDRSFPLPERRATPTFAVQLLRYSSPLEGAALPRDSDVGDGDEEGRILRDVHSPDASFSSGPIEGVGGMRDSGSDADSSHNEISPVHGYTLQTHQEWLKNHLKTTTTEKNKLEQVAVELSEKAERLQYELADAKEATKSKDEVILLLQSQLARMESAYTRSLEESVQSRLQLTNHEQEILHLKEVCFRYEEEKEKSSVATAEDAGVSLRARIRTLEEEKETMLKEILRLEQEKGVLEKRLQEATTSGILDQCQRWKERCESLESARAIDENQSACLSYMNKMSEEHAEREKKLTDRNLELEKLLLEAKEKNAELDAKVIAIAAAAESEARKTNLKEELTDSLTELCKRNKEMEAQIRKLERDVEENELRSMRKKEEEMQVLVQRFAEERETLIRRYETRSTERGSDSDGIREMDICRKENQQLKLTVKRLQEQFEDMLKKSSAADAGVPLEADRSNAKTEPSEERKEAALAEENIRLKRELDQMREALEKERPREYDGGRESVGAEQEVRNEEANALRDVLRDERNALRECMEKNARLEQQVRKLSADSRQGQKPEAICDSRTNKKRGVGREDEIAWNNLYGIKLAGKGREGYAVAPEDPSGKVNRAEFELGSGEHPAADREYERAKGEIRQRLDERLRAEQEAERTLQFRESGELLELKRQIALLRDRMADENTRRTLEGRLAEMEAREKQRLETEVDSLRRRIARDLVPRSEVEALKQQWDMQKRSGESRHRQDDFRDEYRAKCEMFATEIEKSQQIRKRMDGSDLKSTSESEAEPFQRAEDRIPRVVRPQHGNLTVVPSSGDLEPEIKSILNEELDTSIKKHLADVPAPSDADVDLLCKKFLQG